MNPCQTRPSCTPSGCRDALSDFPTAMAYVPWQTFHSVFEDCKALHLGTIFPELCKPFCGKRGSCK